MVHCMLNQQVPGMCFKRADQAEGAWDLSMVFNHGRIDWAPDGGAVVGVNSFRSPQHTAVLLERGCWEARTSDQSAAQELSSLVRLLSTLVTSASHRFD